MNRLKGILGTLVSPLPSFFDLCIAGFLGVLYFNCAWQAIYFVLYSFFLTILTLVMKPKRQYRSWPLMLFTLWILVSIFIHKNIILYPESSFMNSYFVTMNLFEGFIYVFAGILLLNSIIRYSTNLKFLLIIIPFAMIPMLKVFIHFGSMTYIMSFLIAVIVFWFIRKQFVLGSLSLLACLFVVVVNWSWLMYKWVARPLVWGQMIRNIKEHPFVGQGFSHYLWGNHTWVTDYNWGWLIRQNDYLSIGDYMGVIAMLLTVWLAIETIIRVRKTPYLILVLTLMIGGFFQMTMFLIDKSAIVLLLCGLSIKESIKEEL